MNALPQVTTIGETTQGGLSDLLFVFLPNGWLVTLSNEQYTSHDRIVYEGVGIPPEIELLMSPDSLAEGRETLCLSMNSSTDKPCFHQRTTIAETSSWVLRRLSVRVDRV